MIERLDEQERDRRFFAALNRLDTKGAAPFQHPLAPQVSTFALERRVIALESIVAQLLDLPVVRHSGVVTATLEEGE